MAAGDKLAAAALKIATKVPGSDLPVTLAYDQTGDYDAATSRNPGPSQTVLATFGQACEVTNLSAGRSVALLGDYEAGDRQFRVPGPSCTEAQLRTNGVYLTYGDDVLDLMRFDKTIDFGVVTEWRLVGRMRGRAQP